ncbi:hypothetical protein L915_12224 [Phytophthora nicotianae]|uniref:Uncharacterized protein n=1 Tax=Phytophthora nicotianae TaxID=4792 RepID=W2GHH5_PHYNI|nr:hypothetical protein L915_12224 [Phytophthora nicotianae]
MDEVLDRWAAQLFEVAHFRKPTTQDTEEQHNRSAGSGASLGQGLEKSQQVLLDQPDSFEDKEEELAQTQSDSAKADGGVNLEVIRQPTSSASRSKKRNRQQLGNREVWE